MKQFSLLISLIILSSLFSGKLNAQSIYPIQVVTIEGHETTLEAYRGKVILIVNVASKCGFTKQYEGLEALYKTYQDDGLVILGFPCNQFRGQEPGTEAEIAAFCSVRYGVTFPLFAKIEVNGEQAHPLYQFLKKALPGKGKSADVEWNFAKFLVDRNGKPVHRYHPRVKPKELEPDILTLLSRSTDE